MLSFSRDTALADILSACPEAADVLLSYGLHCVGCHVSAWETLEQGCRAHGFPEALIDEIVAELNLLQEMNEE